LIITISCKGRDPFPLGQAHFEFEELALASGGGDLLDGDEQIKIERERVSQRERERERAGPRVNPTRGVNLRCTSSG